MLSTIRSKKGEVWYNKCKDRSVIRFLSLQTLRSAGTQVQWFYISDHKRGVEKERSR